MSLSNNKSEITNITHDEINKGLINCEVGSSQRFVRFLIESMPRRMRSMVEAQEFWTS
jgi:hypothetical protein